ncbi:MAG: SIS domain-containing protein [Chloroflexi bacterium]|nr:SIS domain-containing protein [Chloroflexota bacterium]
MTEELRAQHPYHMYEAIQAQPEAFAQAVRRNEASAREVAERLSVAERLFLVGIGTSFHAALVGEHFLRGYGGAIAARAWHSFDFTLYGPRLTAKDHVVALSHRGTKQYTMKALARAREAGCGTTLITGVQADGTPVLADATLATVAQDPSSAHTISYTGALAGLALLASELGARRTGAPRLALDVLRDDLPAALQRALATEPVAADWAHAHVSRRRIWLVGGGPSAITTTEIALKIKETSYLQAEGMSVETMLHGPFQCAEADDLFVLIAPAGAAQARVVELGPMIRAIGASYVVVSDGTASALRAGASGWIDVPAIAEPFTALTCLVPLQLFSYHLALERGTNPDSFRADDPRFARANGLVEL